MKMSHKYSCHHDSLTLSIRTTDSPLRLRVQVTKKPDNPFRQALLIRPGTVLRLQKGKAAFFVRVRVFCPRINYGRIVSCGELVIDKPSHEL